MPLREYRCDGGHVQEVLLRGQPPDDRTCTVCVRRAQLVQYSRTFIPGEDFRKAEARTTKYKAGAEDAAT